MKASKTFFLFFIVILGILWEFLAQLNIINPLFLPPPSKIAVSLFSNIDYLFSSIIVTVKHITVGFVFGVSIAIFLGFVFARYKEIDNLFRPLILGVAAVPVIVYIPLLILWFGLNETPIYACSTIAAFFPSFLATFHGVKKLDKSYIEVARNFKIKKLIRKVIFPATMPYISNGLRQSIQFVFLITPPAEMIIKDIGMGGFIWRGADLFRTELVLLGMITLAVMGFILFKTYEVIEHKYILKWMPVKERTIM